MKFWLASSDLNLIEKAVHFGVFSGVVTNPAVVAEAECDAVSLFRDIVQLVDVAWYQLLAGTEDQMLADADKMLAINPAKMRIKVPATRTGLGVIARLTKQGLPVMATCVPTRAWMLFAVAAGAKVIAPYGSMLQKRGITSKAEEVVRMQEILDRQAPEVQLLTGIYDVTEIPFYASHGIQSCFIWGRDVDSFLSQPLTDEAAGGFGGY